MSLKHFVCVLLSFVFSVLIRRISVDEKPLQLSLRVTAVFVLDPNAWKVQKEHNLLAQNTACKFGGSFRTLEVVWDFCFVLVRGLYWAMHTANSRAWPADVPSLVAHFAGKGHLCTLARVMLQSWGQLLLSALLHHGYTHGLSLSGHFGYSLLFFLSFFPLLLFFLLFLPIYFYFCFWAMLNVCVLVFHSKPVNDINFHSVGGRLQSALVEC